MVNFRPQGRPLRADRKLGGKRGKAGGEIVPGLADRRGICGNMASGALAQSPADKYPERPIKIIVPFAPGGSTDILARVIGQKMLENWGQQVDRRDAARRRHRDRHHRRRAGRARRLHAAHDGEQPRHQSGAAATRCRTTRSGISSRSACSATAPLVPYVNPKFPPQEHQGAGRLRQDQSGAVRLRRHRQHDAPARRDVQGRATASR